MKPDDATVVLGIETSCDETAASLVIGGNDVLSSVVSSQVDLHARFGGVVPDFQAEEGFKDVHVQLGVNAELDEKWTELQRLANVHMSIQRGSSMSWTHFRTKMQGDSARLTFEHKTQDYSAHYVIAGL